MRDEYDFNKLNSQKNPYASHLKEQITIEVDAVTISYFKRQATETGIPYSDLIGLYLSDCAASKRKLKVNWK